MAEILIIWFGEHTKAFSEFLLFPRHVIFTARGEIIIYIFRMKNDFFMIAGYINTAYVFL